MGFATEAQKEEIRSRIPLEDLLRDYNVHLVRAGKQLKALCPFHQEKTPSFYVYPDKQFYNCYGCNETGDLFKFVQQMERVEFPEALEILARRAGVVLEQRPGAGARQHRRVELYDALSEAAAFYHDVLMRDPQAEGTRQYLERRGLHRDMWTPFQLGFSPPSGDALVRHCRQKGMDGRSLERAGLASSAHGASRDYFRGRLMFPITDVQNRVIGFGARTLTDAVPKYLNTPKTELFDKSNVLYGLAQSKDGIRRRDEVGIVEGYTDAIMAHQAGLDYFVASLGTAFTDDNARRLNRLARRVLIIFDGDSAGQNATERSLDLLATSDGLEVRVYSVVDGKDPCDAISELGGEEFRHRVDAGALGIFEFKWRRTVGALSASAGVVERANAVDEFLKLVARVPNQVSRQLLLRDYVERLGIGEKEVQERLRFLSPRRRATPAAAERRAGTPGPASRDRAANDRAAEAEEPIEALAQVVLRCLCALPAKAQEIWKEVPRRLFNGRQGQLLYEAVDRHVENGPFSAERLARSLEDAALSGMVLKVLSLLEQGTGGSLDDDPEMLWDNCRRDLRRWELRARVRELEELKSRARAEGGEQYEKYRSECSRLLKELKR